MRESASVWLQGCKSDISADGWLDKIASDLVVIRRMSSNVVSESFWLQNKKSSFLFSVLLRYFCQSLFGMGVLPS